MNIIHGLPPKVPENTYVSIDTEWFGLNRHQLHRTTEGKFACMTVCIDEDEDTVYYIDDPSIVFLALKAIDKGVWVIQNAKFDLNHLRRLADIPPRKKLIDTLLIERILWNGYFDLFGLDHLARRYLDMQVDKSIQKNFELSSSMTDEMIKYACLDAKITLQVWKEQRKYLTKTDMRIWKDVDCPALWAFLDFQGFRINTEKWLNLATKNREHQLEIDSSLNFNPRSPKQVVDVLRNNGFKNIPNSQDKTIQKFMKKYPDCDAANIVLKILESRKFAKRASTYGKNFIDNYAEWQQGNYHVIKSNYNVIGATTGRTSSDDPNQQNIPVRDTPEFRECFIARDGNVLLIADLSAQEPRITGYLTQDKNLISVFKSGNDIYIEATKRVFGKTITKADPLRQKMKSTILGLDYGMSAIGLAIREDITEEEAQELIDAFFKTFPGVKRWINKQKKQKKYVTTVLGRKSWLNPYNNKCERNALNSPIQGTAADMVKVALSRIHRDWKFDYPFACVGMIHDELIFDVPEEIKDDVRALIKKHLEEVGEEMCKGIPFKVDIHEGRSWAEK